MYQAFLDDTLHFSNSVKISVENSSEFHVALKAQGEGSTIVVHDASGSPDIEITRNLSKIAFGTKPTKQWIMKEFSLENKGRRPQLVSWVNEKDKKNKKVTKQEVSLEKCIHIYILIL
jgi:hypothetical protein